jgi:3-hydroxybutyryl-CoA dehydrogenase
VNPEEIKRAVVVGAGVMGSSIALVFARAGIETGLVDVDDARLEHALDSIRSSLAVLADAGKVAGRETEEIVARVHPSTDLETASAGAEFAVEAVPEVPEVKQEIFERLEAAVGGDAVIASNTSGLDIYGFAELEKPGRLVIAHWYNPPHIIPLVEVVPGPETTPEVVGLTAALMERLGKVPVVMKGFTRSFIVNKIQNMMSLAIFDLLASGLVTPEDIDKAVKHSLGIRLPVIGVVQSLDFTGLDLTRDIAASFGLTNAVIDEKVEKGELGAKAGKGFYDYGGRCELEICEKRDRLFLEMLERLGEIGAFEPI